MILESVGPTVPDSHFTYIWTWLLSKRLLKFYKWKISGVGDGKTFCGLKIFGVFWCEFFGVCLCKLCWGWKILGFYSKNALGLENFSGFTYDFSFGFIILGSTNFQILTVLHKMWGSFFKKLIRKSCDHF